MKFRFIQNSPERLKRLPGDPVATCYQCGTHCEIRNDEGTLILSEGSALLHPGDNFSRPLGRKIAAGRAIRELVPRYGRRDHAGRAARFDLWNQLFVQSPSTKYGGR